MIEKFVYLFLFLLLVSCSSSDGVQQQRLVLTGSSTVAPLILEIGKRFEHKYGVRIDVQTGGSSRGIADVRRGLSDIGMVSRALDDKERDLNAFPVARDGVGVVLHKDNPVTGLDQEQVIGIYKGEITNWASLGGADAPITVVNKANGRSTLDVFLGYFHLKNTQIKADVVIGDNEQGIKTVAGNPFAIAYVSVGTAEHDQELGIPVKLIDLDGIEASSKTVANGTYPLSRVLNLVTKSLPVGLSRQFIEFSRSKEVLDLVKEQSFVATSA